MVVLLSVALVAAGLWYLVPRPGGGPAAAASTVSAWPDPPVSQGQGPGTTTPITGQPSGTVQSVPATPRTPRTPGTPAPRATQPKPAPSCRVGAPERLRIPALGVDAPFERIGLDQGGRRDANGQAPLGTPTDRTKAGWYAAGPRPGSGKGTVLIDGHTYRDGSAIFTEDFARRIATGQLIQLRQDNGSVCSYRITKVWRTISSAHAYPQLIASQHLYDFAGPERLLLATCGGTWDPAIGNYDDINVVLAVPVTPR
ncbi:hypothetical protein GCM10009817_16680 [Terrabacter lapilli]|uniref:Sortase family protein n=1 Tax=Terrabacter lapilli TaxID=436231 RepID=A0ABN2RY38_9MICO